MRGRRVSTLRWQLLISLLSLTCLGWIAVAVVGYRNAHSEMDQLFDGELVGNVVFLLDLSRDRLLSIADMARIVHASDRVHKYEKKLLVQIWDARGRLLLRSARAPAVPLAARDGFSEREIDGQVWRVFSLTDSAGGIRVQAAQILDIRYNLGHRMAVAIWIPALVLLPLLGLLVWLLVGRAMAPLVRLTRELEQRESDNLRPLPVAGAPGEVRPLVAALNHLFLRLGRVLEGERRFTADAAHELRTPLAALRIHAQMARRTRDEEVRTESLDQLLDGIDRSTHLVQQLLTLARVDAANLAETPRPIDPVVHLSDVLASLAPLVENRRIELRCMDKCRSLVEFAPEALDILLRNLVDNALRYTPEGGRVEVRLEDADDGIRLVVADSGPGIPASERGQVFERFYRGGNGDARGCGLGLSIVQRIAELYGARVGFGRSCWGGLEVEVRFGASTAGGSHLPKRARNLRLSLGQAANMRL